MFFHHNSTDLSFEYRIHPRDKLDVGYRISRSGLAVAYGFNNITYQGPIIVNISVASDSSKVNVTYSNMASPTIELRNSSGFEACFDFSFCLIIIKDLFTFRYVVMGNKFVDRTIQHGNLL